MRTAATTIALAATLALLAAAPAPAALLTYTDANQVWIANPDGSGKRQITTSGAPGDAWRTATSDDRGRVLAARGQVHYLMDQNGALQPNGAQLAPMGPCAGRAGGPSASRISPAGDWVAFYYVCGTGYPNFDAVDTVAITPSQSNTLTGNQIEWSPWQAPTWYGNRLVVSDGYKIFVQPASSSPPAPAAPDFGYAWIAATNVAFTRAAVSRAGDRVLLDSYELANPSNDFLLMLPLPGGVPAATDGSGTDFNGVCQVATGPNPGYPDISPDGRTITWRDDGGVKVAPMPGGPDANSDCVPSGPTTVVSASGSTPAFGAGNLAPPAGPGPGPGSAADRLPPRLGVRWPARRISRRALLRGVVVRASCSEACRVSATMTLDRRTAKRLRLAAKAVTIASASKPLARKGTVKLRLRPRAKTRARLKRGRLRSVTLRVRATDRAGNRSKTATRRLAVRRR